MQHEIYIQEIDLDELMQEAIDEALGRVRSERSEELRNERMGAFLDAAFMEAHSTEPPSNSVTFSVPDNPTSWDDDTVENQVFRPVYRQLTDYQKAAIEDIKSQAAQLLSLINAASNDSRCSCIARTRLEEAVMWAVKGVS